MPDSQSEQNQWRVFENKDKYKIEIVPQVFVSSCEKFEQIDIYLFIYFSLLLGEGTVTRSLF